MLPIVIIEPCNYLESTR